MLYAIVAVAALILDQAVKYWTSANIVLNTGVRELIPGFIHLANVHNTGAAFSMLTGRTVLLALLSVALLGAVLVFFVRCTRLRTSSAVALAALVGGGLGNLTDRVVFGGVTDYIRLLFIPFPVFNLADICITCSILFLILELLTGRLDPFSEKP